MNYIQYADNNSIDTEPQFLTVFGQYGKRKQVLHSMENESMKIITQKLTKTSSNTVSKSKINQMKVGKFSKY